jgi:hypothetical protein
MGQSLLGGAREARLRSSAAAVSGVTSSSSIAARDKECDKWLVMTWSQMDDGSQLPGIELVEQLVRVFFFRSQ